MDYLGTTIYEPTLSHLVLLYVIILIATYPISVALIAAGKIKRLDDEGIFKKANEIVKAQLLPAFWAWIGGTVGCYALLFVWVFIGGLLVIIGVMEPVNSIFDGPLLLLMGIAHIITQTIAYRYVINEILPDINYVRVLQAKKAY